VATEIEKQAEEAEVVETQANEPSFKKPQTETSTAIATVPFNRQLEPTSVEETKEAARIIAKSRLYPRVTPEGVYVTIMKGRDFGLGAVSSMDSIHFFQGKPIMSAQLIIGLVKRQRDICKYFRLVESTNEKAVYETLREGSPEPTRMEYTIEDAKQAGLLDRPGPWQQYTKAMLRKSCGVNLARAEYPDLLLGVYSAEEMEGALTSETYGPQD